MLETRQDTTTQATLAQIDAAVRAADWVRAISLAEQALAQGLEHPKILQTRAIGRERRGLLADALGDFERAHELDAEDVGIAMALGVLLQKQNQSAKAAPLFRTLAERQPGAPVLHFHLATALLNLGDNVGARENFERVIALDPNAAEAFGKLALLASHRGDRPAARELAQRALTLKPGNQDARRVLIEIALDERRFGEAETSARRWLTEPGIGGDTARMQAFGQLGDALEGLERYAEALSAYKESNAAFRRLNPGVRYPLVQLLGDLESELRSTRAGAWTVSPSARTPSPAKAHVFLLGFMRSGTTVLEQALGRSAEVVTLEESETLVAGAHLLNQPGGLAHLSRLPEQEADGYRASYWSTVRAAGVEPDNKVFVDKMPFNGAKLPLIHKLFPDAKIIFALRDPRDVVFSCFQRRLRPSAYTVELAGLEDGARLYDAYMRFVRICRDTFPLSLLEHRHEDLVEDFRASMEKVCDFIGLEFTPEMAEFDVGAGKDHVMSQTARQLRGGLSKRGLGRWLPYAEAMAPTTPILRPWVEAFGYTA